MSLGFVSLQLYHPCCESTYLAIASIIHRPQMVLLPLQKGHALSLNLLNLSTDLNPLDISHHLCICHSTDIKAMPIIDTKYGQKCSHLCEKELLSNACKNSFQQLLAFDKQVPLNLTQRGTLERGVEPFTAKPIAPWLQHPRCTN